MKRLLLLVISLIFLLTFSGCQDDVLLPSHSSIDITKDSPKEAALKIGESVLLNNEMLITFTGVGADSRCPIDVICVWAGDAEIKLKLRKGNLEREVILHTGLLPNSALFDGYEIYLASVLPFPKSNENIKPGQYSIQLKFNYNINSEKKQIHFINSNNDWVLKKDALNVNSANIEKDELVMSVSYGGGCANHIIDLYSYTGILKSNPPQMNLVMSHNANNDMCEAYITKTFRFDLSKIKKYLGGQTGTVILNTAGTDGKPIKQSPLSYRY
ncbi:MAG: hypothetical protein FD143_2159 [Ignavibacteria bacterium]|nr:MAG: hypothetical protein FD143_2159 [Ignavibacteria bacterium]KAF0158888.1 MAG: hypothetical protein FD188_2370 [Ignavibacteria bacterium]